MKKIWEVSAMGDRMYYDAETLEEAKARFRRMVGDELPESMLKWREVPKLPKGESFAP